MNELIEDGGKESIVWEILLTINSKSLRTLDELGLRAYHFISLSINSFPPLKNSIIPFTEPSNTSSGLYSTNLVHSAV